jgi:hypothetical protein
LVAVSRATRAPSRTVKNNRPCVDTGPVADGATTEEVKCVTVDGSTPGEYWNPV